MRATFAVIAVVVVGATSAAVVSAANDPYAAQAQSIVCPSPPQGWSNPSAVEGGRNVLTPLTSVPQLDDGALYFAAPVVEVDCIYRQTVGKELKQLMVSVRYALPTDTNPWADFDIGCTATHSSHGVATAPAAWSDQTRLFRILAPKSWSLATFYDNVDQLRSADVPRFEEIAKTMLNAAQPFAHNCSLSGNGRPVGVQTTWTFSFDAETTRAGVSSSGETNGSFTTTATPNVLGGSVSGLNAQAFLLKVTSKGKTHVLRIKIDNVLSFQNEYDILLRTNVQVLSSNDAACARSSEGTLTVSTALLRAPRVSLEVCGQTYLNGTGSVGVKIAPV